MILGWTLSYPIRLLQTCLTVGRHLYWGYLALIGWAVYQISRFCWTHQPVVRYLIQQLIRRALKIRQKNVAVREQRKNITF